VNWKKICLTLTIIGCFILAPMSATNASGATQPDNTDIELTYSEIELLPDGGKAYIFYIDGVKNKYLVPPEGFNPLTATDEQLEEYCLPPRPKDEKGLTEWQNNIIYYKRTSSEPKLKIIRHISQKSDNMAVNEISTSNLTASNYPSQNWSGYYGTAALFKFTSVQGIFIQPTEQPDSVLNSYECSWVGIGGMFGSGKLEQVGTMMHNYEYYGWYDYFAPGTDKRLIALPSPIHPGDRIQVCVWHHEDTNLACYSVANLTTGTWDPVVVESANLYYDPYYVEWIEERPVVNGAYTTLSDYGTITWTNAYAADSRSTNINSLGSYIYNAITMYDGQKIISQPDPLLTSTSFIDRYIHNP